MSITHTHRRAAGDCHQFRWQRDKRMHTIGIESRWILLHLVIGHMMRRGVWGEA